LLRALCLAMLHHWYWAGTAGRGCASRSVGAAAGVPYQWAKSVFILGAMPSCAGPLEIALTCSKGMARRLQSAP